MLGNLIVSRSRARWSDGRLLVLILLALLIVPMLCAPWRRRCSARERRWAAAPRRPRSPA
jgi:hypothetical protein